MTGRKIKTIKLHRHERIVAVTPEFCAGPGWGNCITWVHIVDYSTNKYRCEDIQPAERSDALHLLWKHGNLMANALIDAIPTRKAKG